jgi:NAD(P)-dependent dehydrogenase (short-subunit alcohol dehydrogenase family)
MENILITGAGNGIGLSLCKIFLEEYPDARILALSRKCDKLHPLKELYPTRLFVFPFDLLRVFDHPDEIVDAVKTNLGTLNILVNNAGILHKQSLEHSRIDDVRQMFEINVFAPGFLVKQLIPLLDKTRRSHILNIGSMGGLQGTAKYPGMIYYSASKAALTVLTECLAEELKDLQVSVNCIAPGAVQTEMLEEAFPGYKAPVSADEMARFIAGFTMNAGNLMNGKILPVALSVP